MQLSTLRAQVAAGGDSNDGEGANPTVVLTPELERAFVKYDDLTAALKERLSELDLAPSTEPAAPAPAEPAPTVDDILAQGSEKLHAWIDAEVARRVQAYAEGVAAEQAKQQQEAEQSESPPPGSGGGLTRSEVQFAAHHSPT